MKEEPFRWMDDGACKGVDQAYFFPDVEFGDGGVLGNYRMICGPCPVKALCLEFALLYNETGVWGGLSELERKRRYDADTRTWLKEDAIESGVYLDL